MKYTLASNDLNCGDLSRRLLIGGLGTSRPAPVSSLLITNETSLFILFMGVYRSNDNIIIKLITDFFISNILFGYIVMKYD
jgi:hypothetical protein